MPKPKEKIRIINGVKYYYDDIYMGRDKNGKVKRKYVYGKTTTELKKKIKELNRKLDAGIKINNSKTFEIAFCNWLFEVQFLKIKSSTKERYESLYRNYIKNSPISNIKLDVINSLDIQQYYNKLVFEYNKTTSIVKSLHKIIKPFLRYCYNEGLTIKDFSISLEVPNPNKYDIKDNEIQVFTIEEQSKFIKLLEGNREKALYILALGTGLRVGELLALTWNDINLKNKTVNVNKSVRRVSIFENGVKIGSKLDITVPKTKESNRIVPIPNNIIDVLKAHKSLQDKEKEKALNLYEDNELVFATEFGKIIESRNLSKRYMKILNDNNIPYKKFHSLRHTYATRLFEKDVPLTTVQRLLGHSDIKMTSNIYTHVLENKKHEAITKIDDLFNI